MKKKCPNAFEEWSDDEETTICPSCNGSGEGMFDETKCPVCRGSGELTYNRKNDPDYMMDADDFRE